MSRLCRSVVVVMTALLMTSGCVVDYLIAPGCKRGGVYFLDLRGLVERERGERRRERL